MGNNLSSRAKICNYNCPKCKLSGATPNMAGRFFIINETQCKCNGCNTIFNKSMIYAKPVNPENVDGAWSFPRPLIDSETDTQAESVV